MEPGDRGDYKKSNYKPEEVILEKPKKKLDFDLNGDGVVDKADMAIAGKTLVSGAKKLFKKK